MRIVTACIIRVETGSRGGVGRIQCRQQVHMWVESYRVLHAPFRNVTSTPACQVEVRSSIVRQHRNHPPLDLWEHSAAVHEECRPYPGKEGAIALRRVRTIMEEGLAPRQSKATAHIPCCGTASVETSFLLHGCGLLRRLSGGPRAHPPAGVWVHAICVCVCVCV